MEVDNKLFLGVRAAITNTVYFNKDSVRLAERMETKEPAEITRRFLAINLLGANVTFRRKELSPGEYGRAFLLENTEIKLTIAKGLTSLEEVATMLDLLNQTREKQPYYGVIITKPSKSYQPMQNMLVEEVLSIRKRTPNMMIAHTFMDALEELHKRPSLLEKLNDTWRLFNGLRGR